MKKLSAGLLLLLGLASPALAQTVNGPIPNAGVYGAYNSSSPTCVNGKGCWLQTDVNGNLKVTSSGGGGGGAVTIADGADVAQGTTTDNPATVPTSGTAATTIALLKALNNTAAASIPAGSAIIGNVRIDQTTPGTTNGVVVNTSALPTGAATAALQSTINTTLGTPFQAGGSIANTAFIANAGTNLNTSLLALESGGNLASLVTQIGAVTASPTANTIADRLKTINTTLGTPMQATGGTVQTIPATTGGPSSFFLQPTASDNHTVIKNGAGQVYQVLVFNNSATVNYLRFYDAGTGFNGCNSATGIISQIQIPASTSVGGVSIPLGFGMVFATGISICVSSGYATTDTTNATATAMSLTILYK